jgi:acyl dehydratase
MPYVPAAELKHYEGKDLGYSDWLTIDQARINLFAEATGDFQFIHVDPVKAAQTPFGSTIAHGFLSLSLMPTLMGSLLVVPEGMQMAINYGLDSVRFIQPVKVNSRVRLKVSLVQVTEKRSRDSGCSKPAQRLKSKVRTSLRSLLKRFRSALCNAAVPFKPLQNMKQS